MYKKTIIPQLGETLRELRGNLAQTFLAEKLEKLLREKFGTEYKCSISQSDISRFETNDIAVDFPKLLAYSTYFKANVSDLIAPEFSSLLNPHRDIQLHQLSSDPEAEDVLVELEQDERIVVSPKFPSSFFCLGKTSKRYKQLNSSSYRSTEIYTIEALLNFLFSPVGRYTTEQKIIKLEQCLEFFQANINRRLFFFPESFLPEKSQLPIIELLPQAKVLLVAAPVNQMLMGDAFIEIKNPKIYHSIADFYSKLPFFESSTALLNIGLETLEKMNDENDLTEAMVFFGQEVKRTRDRKFMTIIKCFNPEIQELIKLQSKSNRKPPPFNATPNA